MLLLCLPLDAACERIWICVPDETLSGGPGPYFRSSLSHLVEVPSEISYVVLFLWLHLSWTAVSKNTRTLFLLKNLQPLSGNKNPSQGRKPRMIESPSE